MKLTPENVRQAWKQHLDSVTDDEFARNIFVALPGDSKIKLTELTKPPTEVSAEPKIPSSPGEQVNKLLRNSGTASKKSRLAGPRKPSKTR